MSQASQSPEVRKSIAESGSGSASNFEIQRGLIPEDLTKYKWLVEVALDPSGTYVAYTVREIDLQINGYKTNLYLRDLKQQEGNLITSGPGSASSPTWSADGKSLAFSWSKGDSHSVQIWSSEVNQLQIHDVGKEPMTGLAFDNDGSHLAGVRWTPIHDESSRNIEVGLPAPTIKVIRRLRYKQDGVGFVHNRYSQISVMERLSGNLTQITDSECDYSEPSWSESGKRLAFVGTAREQNVALGQGQIFLCDYPGGSPVRLLVNWQGACRSPAWGDNDRSIAFAGHNHPAPTNRRVFLTPHLADVEHGTAVELGALDQEGGNYAASDTRVALSNITVKWPAGDPWIYFLLTVEGATHFCRINTTGTFETIASGQGVVFDYSPRAGDAAVYGWADPTNPGDLFEWTSEETKRLTALNPWLQDRKLVLPEERYFEGLDKDQIQGWLWLPTKFDKTKQYPAIVYVHCSMFSWDFSHEFQCLADAGFVVNAFNVRGTTAGYGQAWTRASEGDQGGRDYDETMLGVNDLVTLPFVDENRLGVTGGSCGGFMTNWIVGHTDRFAAAVTQRSISNQISFLGTSDIGPEGTEGETGVNPIENLESSWRQSPIAYVGDIHTPLLIIHSDQDHRCPLEQAEQLFAALRWLGREVELVVFEGESHGLSRGGRPGNRVERLHRILSWFESHIGTKPS